MSGPTLCEQCKDLRHVQKDDGTWERCICLLKIEHDARCDAAGIPRDYWPYQLSKLVAHTPSIKMAKRYIEQWIKVLDKNDGSLGSHRQFVITGNPFTSKALLFLTIKAVLRNHAAKVSSLDKIVTMFLNERRDFERFREAPVVGVFFGDEYTQQIHRYMISHLVTHRSEPRFVTVWATARPAQGIKQTYESQGPWDDEKRLIYVPEEIQL